MPDTDPMPTDFPPPIATLAAEVELATLTKPGELAQVGAGHQPRLVRVAPFPAAGPPIVFIHGIGGDPCNQWILIREAQSRGMRVWTMAYETWKRGAGQNADGFASELRSLAAAGDDDLTVVAHSLGAITTKGALDRLRRPDGHLEGFKRLRFVALSAPWAGVTAADLALYILTGVQHLAYARDLAPNSAYWRSIMETPLAPEVDLYSLVGTWDSFNVFTWTSAGHQARDCLHDQARRCVSLPLGTHNAPNWDERAIQFVFAPDTAPDPASLPVPSGWRMVAREIAASIGFKWAFRERP